MTNKNVDRRQFLKATAAAVGFPYVVSSAAMGKAGTVAPSNRITIGCIGVGGQGTSNLRGFLQKDQVQVVAVCDVDDKHLNRAKRFVDGKYGNKDCATYKDFREVIYRKDIDALSIALPDPWHSIPAIMGAAMGKDMYSEKPLAYTIKEGRDIVNAVEKYGVVWQTGSWQRSVRHFRFGCELARSGKIGQIKTVRVGLPGYNGVGDADWMGGTLGTEPQPVPDGFDYDMWIGPSPMKPYAPGRCHWNWRWISDYSGGQLTDWAGHHIDIAHWGMNVDNSSPIEITEPTATFPSGEDGLYDTPENYRVVAKYEEGFEMIIAAANRQPMGMGVRFEGTEGWIHVNRGGIDANPKSLIKEALGPNDVHLYESNDHFQNFIDCVKSRAKTVTPVATAHHSIMVGHLTSIALRLGRSVKWDKTNEKFINDDAANRLLSRSMRGPWTY